jgi:hypothetical protein
LTKRLESASVPREAYSFGRRAEQISIRGSTMTEKTEWQRIFAWFNDVPYLCLFDQKAEESFDPMRFTPPFGYVDEEEAAMHDMARHLVALKKTQKH